MQTKPFFVHALSPLHAGIGQGVGAIDLPIARDIASGRPLVPGSSIKGVLRDVHAQNANTSANTHAIFGPPSTEPMDRAGAAMFADARLLMFPVRSLSGTFAWLTCPDALLSFQRDALLCGLHGVPAEIPQPSEAHCYVIKDFEINADSTATTKIAVSAANAQSIVYLEDLDLTADADELTSEWARFIAEHLFPDTASWRKQFFGRFCIAPDNVFNFLTETATDVRARIVLQDDSKTVSNLWYEECLPAESVLSGLLHVAPPKITRDEKLDTAAIFADLKTTVEKPLQLGGKATVGRGLCYVRLLENPADENSTDENAAPDAAQDGGDDDANA